MKIVITINDNSEFLPILLGVPELDYFTLSYQ